MEKITAALKTFRKAVESKGILVLRLSVGLIFLWFGFLKFFDDTSAAEAIASRTISWLSAGALQRGVSMPVLAVLECVIGIGILTKKYMQYVIPLMYFQMAGTLLPLVIFAEETWASAPFVPTLEGQYIIKNAVLVSAGIVLGAVSKGGKLIHDPAVAKTAKKIEQQKESRRGNSS